MGLNIVQNPRKLPPRLVLYGTEGIGKSTFGAEAPSPVFVSTEDGLREISADRFPLCATIGEAYQYLQELEKEPHDYQTVVIDSLDWLERLIWDDLCAEYKVKSIEKVDGGYAKGYTHALTYWRSFLSQLDRLNQIRGMLVICLAHAKVEKVEDPEAPSYTRNMPRLHKLAAGLVTEWADAVLFATRKMRVEKEDGGFNRQRTIVHALGAEAGGERVVRCIGGPACIAKNRYKLPEFLPLKWDKVLEEIVKHQQAT